jgi:hypothetical protein
MKPSPVIPPVRTPGALRHPWVALLVLGSLTALLPPRPATAQETNATPRPDFAAFRLIAERNIFNPSRSGRQPPSSREARRTPKVDAFGLVGTLRSDRGVFAFFDGSEGDYRKALKTGATLAGFTVTEISTDSVKLERAGTTTELRVGSQMRREDEGQWQLNASGESFARATPAGGEANTASADSGEPAGGEMSDVLKRLMQKREQELK